MKYVMTTLVFGTLLAFAACATPAGAPDPQAAGDQTTESSPAYDTSSVKLAGALLASEPDDAVPAEFLNPCVQQCDGDEGCIACCHCTHPTQCCM
jgi:hypothetical protein